MEGWRKRCNICVWATPQVCLPVIPTLRRRHVEKHLPHGPRAESRPKKDPGLYQYPSFPNPLGLLKKMRQISIGRKGTQRHKGVERVPLVLGQNSNLLESEIVGWGLFWPWVLRPQNYSMSKVFFLDFFKKKKKSVPG